MPLRSFLRCLWAPLALLAAVITITAVTAPLAPHRPGSPPGLSARFQKLPPPGHRIGDTGPAKRFVRPLSANPDCTLKVPKDPLSAKGLATPYVLASAGMQCTETSEGTAAFVQATILDPATGALTVYNPVVRDAGQPLLGPAPMAPDLPRGAVVTVWTGFNGNVLKLTGPGHNQFVNFAQQGYDNSPQFFAALNQAVAAGKVTVPPLGTASDGMPCPSLRDFSVVDQDQSDNTTTVYPAYGTSNGSDDALLEQVDASLGCTPWQVGGTTSAQLEEAQAAAFQGAPQALTPSLDPFVLSNGSPNVGLQNLYRRQLGQPPSAGNDTLAYCQNLASVGAPRLKADAGTEAGAPAPQFAPIGTNLALVLAFRFQLTWGNLTCQTLTGKPSPIQVTTDNAGIAISATYP